MTLRLKKTVRQMLADANAEIETVSAADAINLKGDPGTWYSWTSVISASLTAKAAFPARSTHRAGCSNSGSIPRVPTTRRFSPPAKNFSSSERAEADLRWQRRPFSAWDSHLSVTWAVALRHGKRLADRWRVGKFREGYGLRALFPGLEFQKILVGKEIVVADQPVAGAMELGDDLFAGQFVLWRRADRKRFLLEVDYNHTPSRLKS